jgi:hypothetical protein
MMVCEAVGLLPWWDIKAWGWLEPELIGLSTSTFMSLSDGMVGMGRTEADCGGAGQCIGRIPSLLYTSTCSICSSTC